MLLNKIGKKILIICTCIMLVVAPNIKNSKAFLLVDDAVVVAVLGGLCALGGVMLVSDSFRDSASDFLSNAVDSYVDYYGGLATDAYDKVKEIATNIYNTGSVAVSDFNDWLHGWLGNFINGYVFPTYSSNIDVPIFNVPLLDRLTFSTSAEYINAYNPVSNLTGKIGFIYGPFAYWLFLGSNPVLNLSYSGDSILCSFENVTFLLFKNGYLQNTPSGGSTNSFYINRDSDDMLKICSDFIGSFAIKSGEHLLYFIDGYFYADPNGTLELDPDIFNKDILGDIDIAPPFTDGLLDNSLDYTNYWVLGNDTTFDNTGDMTFPGTIDVPLDYPYTGVYEQDYPYVIEGDYPLVDDIPKDTVVDTYPDYPITTTPTDTDYKADWSTVFPFCIPFDLFKFLNLLSASPKTPKFDIDVNIFGMKNTIKVDLTPFDPMARIVRGGFDILFILGLMMITRYKLIKA